MSLVISKEEMVEDQPEKIRENLILIFFHQLVESNFPLLTDIKVTWTDKSCRDVSIKYTPDGVHSKDDIVNKIKEFFNLN